MTNKNSFSIKESIRFGWETFKKNWQFLAMVSVVIFLVNVIPSWLNNLAEESLPGMRFIFSIAGWLLQMVTSIGLIVITLKYVDHKVPKLGDLWEHYSLLLNYFLSSLIYGLIVLGGIILLIVPGIYFAVKYQFFSYYVVDKKMGAWEAVKASGKITTGVKWKLVGFGFVSFGIIILGALALGIGVIVAMPVVSLAEAYLYRKLSHKD